MAFRKTAAAACSLAFLLNAPAWGQTQPKCSPQDATPQACSTAIQSGQYSGMALAEAFSKRGMIYCHNKQYSQAIEDYDKSIALYKNLSARITETDDRAPTLKQSLSTTFFNRADCTDRQRQYNQAIQDFDEANRTEPSPILTPPLR